MKNPYPELRETRGRRGPGDPAGREQLFTAPLTAGLDRIERIFAAMRTAAPRHGLGGRGGRNVSNARLSARAVGNAWPPSTTSASIGPASIAEMERHGVESGGGQGIEVFRSGPFEALKKAIQATQFLGYETPSPMTRRCWASSPATGCATALTRSITRSRSRWFSIDLPFYGESGGQVGDTGVLSAPGVHFEVIDTKTDGALILHQGHLREGEIAPEMIVSAQVDARRRQGIRRADSATHLLHYALQKLLGKHAQQQGSKVDDDLLRFDFANPAAVTRQQLDEIEDEVNAKILDAAPVAPHRCRWPRPARRGR